MPVNYRPPRILNHLHPVLLLQLLPVLAQHHLAYGVGPPQHVVVQHCHLKIHLRKIQSNFNPSNKGIEYLVKSVFFYHKNKRFVVIWIEVCHFHCCLLFLSNTLSFGVKQLDLDIRIRGSSNVHLLQLFTLQDTNS